MHPARYHAYGWERKMKLVKAGSDKSKRIHVLRRDLEPAWGASASIIRSQKGRLGPFFVNFSPRQPKNLLIRLICAHTIR